ncbi:YaiI/YqxD family protein [Tundrisphaera sp. TA3]|uniref:YaiI/YqxD family protein n=1 Tax=Tundrisphaera sp. TA3 TaxID=3435775 RepID=UPI003EB91BBA
MTIIYVDADACPVKSEVYKVAARHGLKVLVVANTSILVPKNPDIESVTVRGGLDVADDWIVERIGPGDVVITTDIPLADRCLRKGAAALSPKGYPFTEDSIGEALATRELMDTLRQGGLTGVGPSPFSAKDRSRFLMKLDDILHAIKRKGKA